MDPKAFQKRLRDSALRLATLKGADKDAMGSIGFLLGAVYALQRAIDLEFRAGEIDDAAYADELRQVGAALGTCREAADVAGTRWRASRETQQGIWLAGFYFDCAIHRLAAAAERLDMLAYGSTKGPALLVQAKRDVNKQKHRKEGILLRGREVDSIDAAAEMLEILVEHCRSRGTVT